MFTVKQYQSSEFEIWNKFVANAKNATFLFHRDFMEYHKNRFEDFSLMIYKKNKLVALLPANIEGKKVYSHQGLTYGGLLLEKNIGVFKVEIIFQNIIQFLKSKECNHLYLKMLPYLYHNNSSFELEPFLFKIRAQIIKRDQGFSIDYTQPLITHKTKLKNFKKGKEYDFKIIKNNDFNFFWDNILIPRLHSKYNSKPVHTISEIEKLNSKFPENIIQYSIYKDDLILAGITIFKTDKVVKSQYGATSLEGEKYRALDYLFLYLINKYKAKGYKYFDMGIINENYSLLKQKEELGGSQYIQDTYKIKINSL